MTCSHLWCSVVLYHWHFLLLRRHKQTQIIKSELKSTSLIERRCFQHSFFSNWVICSWCVCWVWRVELDQSSGIMMLIFCSQFWVQTQKCVFSVKWDCGSTTGCTPTHSSLLSRLCAFELDDFFFFLNQLTWTLGMRITGIKKKCDDATWIGQTLQHLFSTFP